MLAEWQSTLVLISRFLLPNPIQPAPYDSRNLVLVVGRIATQGIKVEQQREFLEFVSASIRIFNSSRVDNNEERPVVGPMKRKEEHLLLKEAYISVRRPHFELVRVIFIEQLGEKVAVECNAVIVSHCQPLDWKILQFQNFSGAYNAEQSKQLTTLI